MTRSPKAYDERYFRHWYRGRASVSDTADLRHRVELAVSVTEHVLERPLRSVLDVGCGEARWRAPLKRLRPNATYLGVDPSDWAVRQWGSRRNVRKGSVADLDHLGLKAPFDLIVCDDVLHYVEDSELAKGLRDMRRMANAVVWIQLFTTEDDFEGDRDGWKPRTAAAYTKAFTKAGLVRVAPGCWLPKEKRKALTALER